MRVLVPIALLRSSVSRSGSIFIVFEATNFWLQKMKICYELAISFMGRLTPIYTIYGLLYTTFGLGVRHTGQAGQMAVLLGALTKIYANFTGTYRGDHSEGLSVGGPNTARSGAWAVYIGIPIHINH
jgi:hypothetical protein